MSLAEHPGWQALATMSSLPSRFMLWLGEKLDLDIDRLREFAARQAKS